MRVSRARACVCVYAREREDGKIRQPTDGRTDDDGDNNSVDNAHTRYIRSAGYKNSLLNAAALMGRAQGRKGRRRGNGTTNHGRRRRGVAYALWQVTRRVGVVTR